MLKLFAVKDLGQMRLLLVFFQSLSQLAGLRVAFFLSTMADRNLHLVWFRFFRQPGCIHFQQVRLVSILVQSSFTATSVAGEVVVPEPGTWGAILAGLGVIGFRRRRR